MPGLIELEKLRRNKRHLSATQSRAPNEFATKTVPEDILIDILFLRRR